MNCPYCGSPALPVPRFCCYCGAPLYENNRAFYSAAAAPSTPSQNQAAVPRVQAPGVARPAASPSRAPGGNIQAPAASRPATPSRAPVNTPQPLVASRQSAGQYRSPASSVRMPDQSRQSAGQSRAPAGSAQASASSRSPAVSYRAPASSVRASAPSRPAAASYRAPASYAPPEAYPIQSPAESSVSSGAAAAQGGTNPALLVSLIAILAGIFIIIMAVAITSSSHRSAAFPGASSYSTTPFAAPQPQAEAKTQSNPLIGKWSHADGATLIFTENTIQEYNGESSFSAQYELVDGSHFVVYSGSSSEAFSFEISGDTLILTSQREPSHRFQYARVHTFTET